MSARHTILVVEDEMNIRLGLRDSLEDEGYEVLLAEDGREGLRLFKQHESVIDLALLDVMMPELSGFDLCREIRKRNARIPVLMLTAKGEEVDKVVGLELGADDYIVKPFGVRELLARISAAYRRAAWSREGVGASPALPPNLPLGEGVSIDRANFNVLRAKSSGVSAYAVRLTAREMKLVECLWTAQGGVVTRDQLLDEVWGIDYGGTTRTLDQHVAQLRKKLNPDEPSTTPLETVHGIGYRLRVLPQQALE